ncbi:MAG: hypothetical protein CFE37_08025 [Alphaproteobacteria bacterium PA4]|nr:MAG: hypothetical protein CFE37_08025 [Alphaproteobacteria bacterium PA4]
MAPLALSACASTQTVLSRPATEVYRTDLSVNKVAFCLANKNNVAVLDQDDGAKIVLLKNGYRAVSKAFTIYPDGRGSRVEVRDGFKTLGGIWKQCVLPARGA